MRKLATRALVHFLASSGFTRSNFAPDYFPVSFSFFSLTLSESVSVSPRSFESFPLDAVVAPTYDLPKKIKSWLLVSHRFCIGGV